MMQTRNNMQKIMAILLNLPRRHSFVTRSGWPSITRKRTFLSL